MHVIKEFFSKDPLLYEIAKFTMLIMGDRQVMIKKIDQVLEDNDISSYDLKFLMLVANTNKLLVSELSELVGVTNSTVSIRLSSLENKELVTRVVLEEDKRKKIIKVTTKGQEILSSLKPNNMENFVAAMHTLDNEETKQLTKIVAKLSTNFAEISNLQDYDFDMKKELQRFLGFE